MSPVPFQVLSMSSTSASSAVSPQEPTAASSPCGSWARRQKINLMFEIRRVDLADLDTLGNSVP
jgi:hypothetical protein